jgi:hypothetical protein
MLNPPQSVAGTGPMPPETVPVGLTVIGVEPVRGSGKLIALGIIKLDIGGVIFRLQGVQILRQRDGSLTCAAPCFRHPRDGRWLPAVLLPPELSDAIAAEVLAEART